MNFIRRCLGLLAIAGLGAACSAATEGPTTGEEIPGSRVSVDALKGGCRWDCPKCPPNQVCSLAPCVLKCPPDVVPCGPSVCGAGQYCCNESCGICAEDGLGFCTQQYCEPVENGKTCNVIALCAPGYVWSTKTCKCMPDKNSGSECSTDADCRLEADYCTGCDCLALSPSEQVPYCDGPGVKCFADPCMTHTAACIGGQCTLL